MNRQDFKTIAGIRAREARILLDNECFSGAYYLLGYSVECALKACIAKQIKRFDIPDRKFVNAVYTHNLQALLELSGLKNALESEFRSAPRLEVNWTLVKGWSEESRYIATMPEKTAKDFYEAVTARNNGVLTWLKQRW